MKFLFVTYRWGDDLVGGAEIHHRRLAQELVEAGHEVEVLTSTAHELEPFWHWGVMWKDRTESSAADVRLSRLARRQWGRYPLALACKLIQQQFEREEAALPDSLRQAMADQFSTPFGVHLLEGWHYPEKSNGETARWTHPRAAAIVRAGGTKGVDVVYRGQADRPLSLVCRQGTNVLATRSFQPGYVEFSVPLPDGFTGILELHVDRAKRWARDHRTLGCWFNSLELKAEGRQSFWTDFSEDFRALGRHLPLEWQSWLLDRARARPRLYEWLFDQARGPVMPECLTEIARRRADVVIHCNLPWGSFRAVRKGDLAMPLWHIDDEFYYWHHYIEALQRSRLVLANTPHTANEFFPRLGMKAAFVGPPIWEPKTVPADRARAFRQANGIDASDVLVLTVCRKAGEKRYDAIASAVERLRNEGLPVRMIGVGPDVDGLPFNVDGCAWLGKLTNQSLQDAYGACDIFALMSESESFGMVIPEAWHHGKPVVVNALCQPVVSLLDVGVDGVSATPGDSLAGELRALVKSESLRKNMGAAGRRKALEHYTRGSAARRLLAVLS